MEAMKTDEKKIAEKLAAGRQYRAMTFETLNPKETGESRIVEGHACTFGDTYTLFETDDYIFMEQVDARAFDKSDLSDVIFQYNHVGRVFARVSNNTLALKVDERGLFIRADLAGTHEGRRLFEEIHGGYTTKMSFGFTVRGERMETSKDASGRTIYLRVITDVSKVYDVSAVSLPANDGTDISARAYCEGVIASLEAERLKADEEARRRKIEADERERKFTLLEMNLLLGL